MHAPFLLGLIAGGAVIYWFTGASAQAVTTGAYRAVEFIKKNIKLESADKASVADSKKVVEICTKYAQKGMLNIFLVVFFATLSFAFLEPFFFVGYLISIALFGLYQAIFMANAGGAWDNAKKVVETELRAKGTPLHDACVVGDTVGDPFKDTSSVALNPIIKFTTLFGLLAVSLAVDLTAIAGQCPHHRPGRGLLPGLAGLRIPQLLRHADREQRLGKTEADARSQKQSPRYGARLLASHKPVNSSLPCLDVAPSGKMTLPPPPLYNRRVMHVPLTPIRCLYRAVDLYGRKTGIVSGDSRFTYAEFGERCERLAPRAARRRRPAGRPRRLSQLQHPPASRRLLRRAAGPRHRHAAQRAAHPRRTDRHPQPRRSRAS